MKFVVCKDEEGNVFGMLEEEKENCNNELEVVEAGSWEDFKKFLVAKYGRVNAYVVKGGERIHLFDVRPDYVAEFKIQVPVWLLENGDSAMCVINVCGGKLLTATSLIGKYAGGLEKFLQLLVLEALKHNRFGEPVEEIAIKKVKEG